MNKNPVTEARIIRMTIDTIRGFYSRNPDMNTAPMADNFMWIGANDFQWCESLEEFLRVTKKEYEEPPVMLSDEEFHLLFHERNVWVVYGRYKISTVLEDGSAIYALKSLQLVAHARTIENVVAQHHGAWLVPDECIPQNERLRQAVRRGLHLVRQLHAELASVAQKRFKTGRVLRC